MVYPDPEVSRTRCLFSANKDYKFQVIPRNREKLLLHFEGGGACWNMMTTMVLEMCWRDQVWAMPTEGTFLGATPENPFKDYSVVVVNMCSGDLHSGNTSRTYRDDSGHPVEQRGYYNTRAVLDWIQVNFGREPVSELLITGESAGAIGVQVWSRVLLSELAYDRVAVVMDSYTGAFPEHFEGHVFNTLHVCETGILQLPELEDRCKDKTLTIADTLEAALRDFPDVPFVMLNTKFDTTQESFYNMAAMTAGNPKISSVDLYAKRLELLRRFNHYPNFVQYLSTGFQHVFLTGYLAFGQVNETELLRRMPLSGEDHALLARKYLNLNAGLVNFLSALPPARGAVLHSSCELLDQRTLAAMRKLKYPVTKDICDPELSSKQFTAP